MFNVILHLSFQPEEIETDTIECTLKTDTVLPMVDLTVCFETIEATKSKESKGQMSKQLLMLHFL